MAKSLPHDADSASAPSVSTVWLLLGTVGDTTWRLFLPTIGGTVLGIWIDKTYDTTPMATVLGVIIGSLMAFGLVYLQIRKVQK